MTFPKIELHVHLEGTMRPATRIRELLGATRQNAAWPPAAVPAGKSS